MENVSGVRPLYWGEQQERSSCPPRRGCGCFWFCFVPRQIGRKHEQARPLKGFGSAGVLEIVEDWRGNTYRAVYTVSYRCGVFVLHVFQKKAKRGIATPAADLALIRARLKAVEQDAKEFES